MLHALIMAGGGGTRFWPRSRASRPKQFLTLAGDQSLLQQSFERLESQVELANTWIMTSARHRDEVLKQLPHLLPERVIGEPIGRDTAPCIGLGAALISQTDPDAIMLVTPADHVIEPTESFRRAIRAATLAIEQQPDALVTLGIPPTHAATGYGYIRRGSKVGEFAGIAVSRVDAFREKPSAEIAQQYLTEGSYYWNAGIFVWKASTVLAELRRNKPKLAEGVERLAAAWPTPERDRSLSEIYPNLERISIDYAIMEPAKTALVLEAPFRWDDVGSWLAMERLQAQDADGNTVQAKHCGIGTRNCIIVGDKDRLIATANVRDLLIIQDGDALLIADRHDEAAVKKLVEQLGKTGLERFL
jgi:mannose-1-phosphate guanylyltransferase